MVVSKSQIRKLGERIRKVDWDRKRCSDEDIRMLQSYRLDHKGSLSYVFDTVSELSKKVHSGRMVAFRLKKIDTILSKLKRSIDRPEGKMELDRMWDVAGCRVIVQSESAVYKLLDLLREEFDIKRFKDSMKVQDPDGYRGYHLYVQPKNIENARVVEIQLRTIYQHHWATLVEVIDVIYDTNIKVGDISVPDLNEFLKIYSKWNETSLEERKKAFLTELEHNIYTELSNVFSDNILELRSDWVNLSEYGEKEPYILFNVDQNTKRVSFRTFKTIEDAEDHYLNDFMKQDGDFMVARLNVKYFVQLAFVYANYVLSNHSFLESWLEYILHIVNDDKFDDNFVLNTIAPRVHDYESEFMKAEKNEQELISFFEEQPDVNKKMQAQLKKWKTERSHFLKTRKELLELIKVEIEKRKIRQAEKVENFILKVLGVILIIGLVVYVVKFFNKK